MGCCFSATRSRACQSACCWRATSLRATSSHGNSSRLNRPGIAGAERTEALYAAEELVAEMGSAFLCAHCGIQGRLQHASYIGSWLDILRQDKRAVIRVSGMARHASEWLLTLYHNPVSLAPDSPPARGVFPAGKLLPFNIPQNHSGCRKAATQRIPGSVDKLHDRGEQGKPTHLRPEG
ncbi:zincin-like metallopeptidase domain-containing protein [Salmonella enterica]|uniref:zincin-like metallopeptidase domain-containing protein n=1 Tax=Salmonella enterica TaxID=28901 RepID=UPI0034674908